MEHSPREVNSCSSSQEISFYGTQRFICMLTSLPQVILSQMNLIHTLQLT